MLPPDWTLVGGLMVQLHALEHDMDDVRVTVDIDVLGEARPPGALPAIDQVLGERRIPGPSGRTATTTPTATSATV